MTEIEKALAQEGVQKSMEKVKKTRAEVSINPKKFLVEYAQQQLAKLAEVDKSTLSEAELAQMQEMEAGFKETLETGISEKLEGVMVPLKYQDYQVIKSGVLEALKYATSFNFDEDIKIKAMLREEHTLTVFFSLRKKEDITKRYYEDLETIGKENESVIEELYSIYVNNFVLTEQERKNS